MLYGNRGAALQPALRLPTFHQQEELPVRAQNNFRLSALVKYFRLTGDPGVTLDPQESSVHCDCTESMLHNANENTQPHTHTHTHACSGFLLLAIEGQATRPLPGSGGGDGGSGGGGGGGGSGGGIYRQQVLGCPH